MNTDNKVILRYEFTPVILMSADMSAEALAKAEGLFTVILSPDKVRRSISLSLIECEGGMGEGSKK